MLNALIGRKIGMTQIFVDNGTAIPVTVIEAGPCVVTQLKTEASDGYAAVQIGYGLISTKHATRPELGHLGHGLPTLAAQRRRQQEQNAKARQEARTRQGEANEEATATEAEADEAESQTQSTTKNAPARRRRARAGGGLGPFE